MKIRALAIVFLATMLVAACSAPELTDMEIVQVRVLENGRDCMVSDRQTACAELPNYLQGKLKSEAILSISGEARGLPAERVRSLAQELKQAGFKNVAIAGFITEPEPNNTSADVGHRIPKEEQ